MMPRWTLFMLAATTLAGCFGATEPTETTEDEMPEETLEDPFDILFELRGACPGLDLAWPVPAERVEAEVTTPYPLITNDDGTVTVGISLLFCDSYALDGDEKEAGFNVGLVGLPVTPPESAANDRGPDAYLLEAFTTHLGLVREGGDIVHPILKSVGAPRVENSSVLWGSGLAGSRYFMEAADCGDCIYGPENVTLNYVIQAYNNAPLDDPPSDDIRRFHWTLPSGNSAWLDVNGTWTPRSTTSTAHLGTLYGGILSTFEDDEPMSDYADSTQGTWTSPVIGLGCAACGED